MAAINEIEIFRAVVNKQSLKLLNVKKMVAPTRGIYKISCEFSKDWEETEIKTAAFIENKTKKKYLVRVINNQISAKDFPEEVAWNGGSYKFDIWGESFNPDGSLKLRITTEPANISIYTNKLILKELSNGKE